MISLLILFAVLTLSISFICSMMEAILLSITEPFIETKATEGKSVYLLQKIKNNIDKSLSAILSLNTIANTIGAASVGVQATKLFGDTYFGIISACLTFLILIFSEIVPKTIGTLYWRKIAFFAGYIISIITFIMYPLVFISQFLTGLFSKNNQQNVISREEVVAMADIGSREGVFEEKESAVIQNMIHLKEKKVRDIMTPRIVISSDSEETTLKDFFEKKTFLQHSRIPVYSVTPDNITGYILKMDVMEYVAQGNDYVKLKNIKRNILIYYENFSVSGLFDLFMKNREHIALIVDEFGNVAGIATMEDIIETLIGMEIVDERDKQVDMQQLAKDQWEKRSQNMDI